MCLDLVPVRYTYPEARLGFPNLRFSCPSKYQPLAQIISDLAGSGDDDEFPSQSQAHENCRSTVVCVPRKSLATAWGKLVTRSNGRMHC